jgi:hypothetical protein
MQGGIRMTGHHEEVFGCENNDVKKHYDIPFGGANGHKMLFKRANAKYQSLKAIKIYSAKYAECCVNTGEKVGNGLEAQATEERLASRFVEIFRNRKCGIL